MSGVSGIVEAPWGFQFSMISTFISRPPVNPTVAGFDNTGTNAVSGGGYTPLPGHGFSGFMSKGDLINLVAQYNGSMAGTLTPAGAAGLIPGQKFPTITLPPNFQLGDNFFSQDLRITKTFKLQ